MQTQETINYINKKICGFAPEIAVILGSGLGCFCEELEGINLKYSEIPNFTSTSISGHKGELLFTTIGNKNVVVMQGRFHFYEGNTLQTCTYPIKVFKKLGVKTLFITNAAGAAHKELNVGDIVTISDHINFIGSNPLIGKNDDTLGERFPDMSDCYSKKLRKLAHDVAKTQGLNLKEGIYLATSGPSYETAAEVKAFRILGADVIGMSSAPEAIVANYLKMDTIGFSLVTNHCTGVSDKTLSHEEVIEIGKTAGRKLSKLIKGIICEL